MMLKFAIVGCGHIARKHVEAVASEEGAVLHGVYDTNRIIMKQLIAHDPSIIAYSDYTALLADPDVDIVNICTPSGLHAPLATQAANAGKHVIVEKPIALTLEDADAIIQACERNGVKLSVVHPNRFRPAVMKLMEEMKNGSFGKISHINATVRWNRNQTYYDQASWRGTKALDGGVLMNQAIHNLDLLLWAGGPVQDVQAYTATRLRSIEAEDVAVGIVKFASGALGVIEAAATVYPKNLEESISIFGEQGTAVIGGTTANWLKHWAFAGLSEEDVERTMKEIAQDPYGMSGHRLIIRDMMEAIEQHREPVVSGLEGRNALELVLKLYAASAIE